MFLCKPRILRCIYSSLFFSTLNFFLISVIIPGVLKDFECMRLEIWLGMQNLMLGRYPDFLWKCTPTGWSGESPGEDREMCKFEENNCKEKFELKCILVQKRQNVNIFFGIFSRANLELKFGVGGKAPKNFKILKNR